MIIGCGMHRQVVATIAAALGNHEAMLIPERKPQQEEINDMAEVTITVDRDRYPQHTDEQFEEWVEWCNGGRGGCGVDNPLSNFDLTAEIVSVNL